MKRSTDLSLSMLPILFFIAFVALVSGGAHAQDKIRIGISSTSPGFLPTVVAEQKGFFTKYGLSSEHIRISLAVAMNALGTGDLDYAITMAQGVSAAIRGVPVKLLMLTQDKLVFFLMVKPGVQQVGDLRNKTIGISYFGSTTHLVVDVIARRNGLVPGKDVNILPCGDDNGRIVALDTGRVDAVIGGAPPWYQALCSRPVPLLAAVAPAPVRRADLRSPPGGLVPRRDARSGIPARRPPLSFGEIPVRRCFS